MPLTDTLTFTFNHVDQQDDLYKAKTASEVKTAFDSRGEQLKTLVLDTIKVLKSTTDNDSGADNIAATPIDDLGDAGTNTVQKILEALKALDDTNRTYLLSQIQATALGQIPGGTITDAKLSGAPDQIKERFTSHLADFVTLEINQLDTAIELEILKGSILTGVDSNICIETFQNINDVVITHGSYNSTNKRVELNTNTYVKALGFSFE
jgi:hypothetical protein